MRQIICVTILIVIVCLNGFSQTSKNICPQIKFVSPTQIINPGEPAIFSVEVGERKGNENLSYEWTFSLGKILKGQGTSQIEFIASDEENGANLNVAVKIIGLPENCVNTESDVFGIASFINEDPLDNFGKESLDQRRGRLDVFMTVLANNPNAEGLIHIFIAEDDSQSYKMSLLKNIYRHFVFRKFDVTRVSFVISEGKSEETLHWIIFPGGKLPRYISKENYQLIRAVDLNRKLTDLFPKK